MHKTTKVENGTIVSPKGFSASVTKAGIKVSGNEDMALIYSEVLAVTSGAFTSNKFQAAPVIVSKNNLEKSFFSRAIIINSGNANACTGDEGVKNAEMSANKVAKNLSIRQEEVLIASTGIIGQQLDMHKIFKGIEDLTPALSRKNGHHVAKAIMTTDTKPKETCYSFEVDGKLITIAGIAKGAGMIAPELKTLHATMLSFITTDADISPSYLRSLTNELVELTFNRISIDGDMSTNDSLFIMANGLAGNDRFTGSNEGSLAFKETLYSVMKDLAEMMVLDGEGVTKFVKVCVNGALTYDDAKKCTLSIVNSLLCKTAWFGNDPNWGRIACAVGYSGAQFDKDKVDIFFDNVQVVKSGCNANADEDELLRVIREPSFEIHVNLNAGSHNYFMLTGDISYDYVKINADYHT